MLKIIFMAIITAIGGFVGVILYHSYKVYKKQKLIRRLQRQMIAPKSKSFSLLDTLGYNRLLNDIDELFRRAGLSKINAEDAFLSFIVILSIVFAMLTVTGTGWLSVVLPAVLAIAVPWSLGMIGTARHNKLNRQFSDIAQDMADHLKLIPNLENALREVVETAEQPLRGELEKILHKMDLGIGIIPALKDFARGSESSMIDFWVDSIIFAYQMRASVADVCEEVSKKIRMRMKQNAQVSTKLTEIKSMMFAIAGIMLAMIFLIYSSSPEYLNSFNTTGGKIALIYTIASYVGSTLYILRRINKEVTEL
jgi:tight adherence protein B